MMKLCAGLILVVLAMVVLHCPSSPASTIVPNPRLVNFLYLMCGVFNDSREVSEDVQNKEGKVHGLLSVSLKPVQVPAFPSSLTWLFKEAFENKLNRLQISLVSLDPDGVIRVKSYRIENLEKYTFDTPETEIIAELKEGDLTESNRECDSTYSEIEPNVFFGTAADCLDYSTNPPKYPVLVTCNVISGLVLFKASETANPRPYKNYLNYRYSLSLFSDIFGDISSIKDPCVC